MRARWPGAKMPVPVFVVSGSAGKPFEAMAACAINRTSTSDPQLVREAIRARSIAHQEGPVWDAYAGCDRAPMNWERGA